jgi:site-specific DNA-methyltransferase (adenine-specific)
MFDFESIKNQIILADCMDVMKDIPDKFFELAIVDPPYGINVGTPLQRESNNKTVGIKGACLPKVYRGFDDSRIPDEKYFKEIIRITKNQIIWGGNYFIEYLHNSSCWIVWDKRNEASFFADCELAWTSFDTAVRKFSHRWNGMIQENMGKNKEERIHPTQKPIALYRWLLQNYAKEGDKIIDTHSGSGSLSCACHIEKFDFLAIEKDPDYHRDSVNRLNDLRCQGVLF